jgi:hypothetical protein
MSSAWPATASPLRPSPWADESVAPESGTLLIKDASVVLTERRLECLWDLSGGREPRSDGHRPRGNPGVFGATAAALGARVGGTGVGRAGLRDGARVYSGA